MLIKLESSKQLFQHKKVIFVSFSVIQVGIAEPELANSSLGVLAFEVNQTKIQGASAWSQGLPVLWGAKSSWVVTQLKFNQEDKLTEKQGL